MGSRTHDHRHPPPGPSAHSRRPVFGAHQSIAGGFDHAFQAGAALGCDCLQIFVRNQRQWRSSVLTDSQIASYRAAERDSGLAPVVEIDDPGRRAPVRQVATPIRLSATPATYRSAPPRLT